MKHNNISLIAIFIFASICLSGSISAQEQNVSEIDISKLEEQGKELEGTFQIEMINTRSLPTFHISLYEKISSLRDETEVVYYEVSDVMRIKILPKSIIKAEDFKSVERITHISTKEL